MSDSLEWVAQAKQQLLSEMSTQTPLLKLSAIHSGGSTFFLKDESINPVGSWRQRVARVFFLQALGQGRLEEDKPVVSSSPPWMAIAEAWYAQLLGLPYIAIIPEDCPLKVSMQIEFCSGICHRVSGDDTLQGASREVAEELTGVLFENMMFDAHLLRTATESLVTETEEQLVGYGRGCSKITFLMGASAQELKQALGTLHKELRCNRPFCVNVASRDCAESVTGQKSLKGGLLEVSPAKSRAGVEWLSDVTGRRFSLETGAIHAAIVEREERVEKGNECVIIIAESTGCYESGQSLSQAKRGWLRYRESFQLKGRIVKATIPLSKAELQ